MPSVRATLLIHALAATAFVPPKASRLPALTVRGRAGGVLRRAGSIFDARRAHDARCGAAHRAAHCAASTRVEDET